MNFSQFASVTHLPAIAAFLSFVLLALTICRNGVPKYCSSRHFLKAIAVLAIAHVLWNCINVNHPMTVFSFYHSVEVWIVVAALGFYLSRAGFQQGKEAFLGELVNPELAAAHLYGLTFEAIECVLYGRVGAQGIDGDEPVLKETATLWIVRLRCTTPGRWCNKDVMYIHKGQHTVTKGPWVFDTRGLLQKTADLYTDDSCCP